MTLPMPLKIHVLHGYDSSPGGYLVLNLCPTTAGSVCDVVYWKMASYFLGVV